MEGPVSKLLTIEVWGPQFGSPDISTPRARVRSCEAQTGESLEFWIHTSQLA